MISGLMTAFPRGLPPLVAVLLALGAGGPASAVPQTNLHGGVFFEAEDFDERLPEAEGFAALTGEPAASDGTVLFRFHHGVVIYRFRVPAAGRWRAWLRYGAPGPAVIQAGVDPSDTGKLEAVELPATGGCVGPGVWSWRVVAEADLDAGEHRLALGSAALRPDCLWLTTDARARPNDQWLKEVRWPPGPRLPELRHDRRITRHPKWLGNTLRICYAHVEWNREITIEEWCARAAAAGARVIAGAGEIPAGMLNGRIAPTPARNDALPEGLQVRYDWVKRYADAAHARGLKFLCYVNADRTLDPLLVQHPDWRQVRSGGTPWPGWGSWSSPYRKAFNDRLVRIARQSRFDGIFIDMPFAGPPGGDFSPWMTDAFRRKFGVDPPRKLRSGDPLFQRWIDFQAWVREEWLLDLTEALHAVDPEIAVVVNQTRGWIFKIDQVQFLTGRVGRCVDGLAEEVGWETQHAWKRPWAWPLEEAWQNLFLRCRARPGFAMMWHVTYNMPAVSLQAHAFAMLANGAAPSVTTGGNWPQMTRVWRHIRACEPWVAGARLTPWAAIHFSERTLSRVMNPRGEDDTNQYLRGVFGFFQACLETHLPVEIVTDDQLADPEFMRRYAVLVLPDSASLDAAQLRAVRHYVEGGGGLVATLETGRYDEFGAVRDAAATRELLGCLSGKTDQGVAWSMPLEAVHHPILDHPDIRSAGMWSQGLIESRKAARLAIGPSTRKVAAVEVREIAPGATAVPLSGAWRLRRGPIRPEKGWALRTLIARTLGAGKVVYFPLAIGNAYFGYNHPVNRALIVQSMRWAADRPPPLKTDAPMLVQTVLYRKGDAVVVHLLNDISSFGRSAAPNPEAFGGFRSEYIPVRDITVEVPGAFRRARLVPGNTSLAVTAEDGATRTVVPRLDIHAMVVFEP